MFLKTKLSLINLDQVTVVTKKNDNGNFILLFKFALDDDLVVFYDSNEKRDNDFNLILDTLGHNK